VEFGLMNATMHKLDEAVAVQDLEMLTTIYADIVTRALTGQASNAISRFPAGA
jgi:succinyl-diaminopimelate desuccinylase